LLLNITSTADELSVDRPTNIDDLERHGNPPKIVLVNFSRFEAAVHILRVNFAETVRDRPRQSAYEIFSIKHRF